MPGCWQGDNCTDEGIYRYPTPTPHAKVTELTPENGAQSPSPYALNERRGAAGAFMACHGHLQAVTQASAVPGRLSRQSTPDNLGIHISPHRPPNSKNELRNTPPTQPRGHHTMPGCWQGDNCTDQGIYRYPTPTPHAKITLTTPGNGARSPSPFPNLDAGVAGASWHAKVFCKRLPQRPSRQRTPDNLGIHTSPHHPRNLKQDPSHNTNYATGASHHARVSTRRQLHKRRHLSISRAHAACKSHNINAQEWGSVPVDIPRQGWGKGRGGFEWHAEAIHKWLPKRRPNRGVLAGRALEITLAYTSAHTTQATETVTTASPENNNKIFFLLAGKLAGAPPRAAALPVAQPAATRRAHPSHPAACGGMSGRGAPEALHPRCLLA